MASYYDEVEIEDMEFDEENLLFHSPCPCGDRFEISLTQLQEGEDIARCPSCSLIIRVIYDPVINPEEDELILKDDFVDDEKESGKEMNAMVEVTA